MYVEARSWATQKGIGATDLITGEIALDYLTDLFESPVSGAMMVKYAPAGLTFRLLVNLEGLTAATNMIAPIDYTPPVHKTGFVGLAHAEQRCRREIRTVQEWWEHLTEKHRELGVAAERARLKGEQA